MGIPTRVAKVAATGSIVTAMVGIAPAAVASTAQPTSRPKIVCHWVRVREPYNPYNYNPYPYPYPYNNNPYNNNPYNNNPYNNNPYNYNNNPYNYNNNPYNYEVLVCRIVRHHHHHRHHRHD